MKGFNYSYDGLSRLKDAVYGEGDALSTNAGRFNEQVTGYNKLGNILRKVTDRAASDGCGDGFDFKDGAITVDSAYDANGNLTGDLNKRNCLNLPSRIEFEGGSIISASSVHLPL